MASAAIDRKPLDTKSAVYSAIATGAINSISGIGAGIGTALKGMPDISATTVTLANSLNAACSVVTEAVCDFFGWISSKISSWKLDDNMVKVVVCYLERTLYYFMSFK